LYIAPADESGRGKVQKQFIRGDAMREFAKARVADEDPDEFACHFLRALAVVGCGRDAKSRVTRVHGGASEEV
jgi:hypothetical protein